MNTHLQDYESKLTEDKEELNRMCESLKQSVDKVKMQALGAMNKN